MNRSDQRWHSYYITGAYKGFRKHSEKTSLPAGTTHLTFSNGEQEIVATGTFKEEAIEQIFNRIDKHHLVN